MATKTVAVPLSNEETDSLYKTIKTNMHTVLESGEKGDVARSDVIRSCIILGASNPTIGTELFNRSAGVFLNRKTHSAEYDGAWSYFNDLYSLPSRLTSENEPDRMDRERHNNKVSAAMQFVRYAASIYYAIGSANVWSEFSKGKNKGVVMLTIPGAKALFPKRATSLDKSEFNVVAITHRAGEYRFSSIADAGLSLLESKGIKERTSQGRQRPVRDVMAETMKSAEAADSKAFDAPTRKATLAALVALVDAMNDASIVNHLDSKVVAPFRAHLLERMETEDKASAPIGTPLPKTEAEQRKVA